MGTRRITAGRRRQLGHQREQPQQQALHAHQLRRVRPHRVVLQDGDDRRNDVGHQHANERHADYLRAGRSRSSRRAVATSRPTACARRAGSRLDDDDRSTQHHVGVVTEGSERSVVALGEHLRRALESVRVHRVDDHQAVRAHQQVALEQGQHGEIGLGGDDRRVTVGDEQRGITLPSRRRSTCTTRDLDNTCAFTVALLALPRARALPGALAAVRRSVGLTLALRLEFARAGFLLLSLLSRLLLLGRAQLLLLRVRRGARSLGLARDFGARGAAGSERGHGVRDVG
mmetsp:Transcript_6177/g.21961  ORF Transcript_6177/g.21961 Transcript_6177/m.21961 type:complete len:287 (-) Transcript_6177:1623-2483(-)